MSARLVCACWHNTQDHSTFGLSVWVCRHHPVLWAIATLGLVTPQELHVTIISHHPYQASPPRKIQRAKADR